MYFNNDSWPFLLTLFDTMPIREQREGPLLNYCVSRYLIPYEFKLILFQAEDFYYHVHNLCDMMGRVCQHYHN
jgi:hypothetical protein